MSRVRQRYADHTVSWDGTRWGVPREEVCTGLRGAQVEIERRLDGSHWLRYRGRYFRLRHCPAPLQPSASPSGLRPAGLAEQTPKPKHKIKSEYHVPAHHPWKRKPWKRTFLFCVDMFYRVGQQFRDVSDVLATVLCAPVLLAGIGPHG